MKKSSLLVAMATVALSSPAFAGTADGTLGVTLTVANNCTLGAGSGANNAVLDFGLQQAGDLASAIDGSTAAGGNIVLTCSGDTPDAQISFSAGSNANGNQRRIKYDPGTGTPSFVQYDLFIDSGRANPLLPGQNYNLRPDALANGLVSGDNIITVFGRIPAGETLVNTGASSYTDTVNFTITF